MQNAKTYDNYLSKKEKIDNLIGKYQLSCVLLASLLRLRKKQSKEPDGMFMQSEFAGMGVDEAVALGYASREYKQFEWHPKGEGTHYYRLTDKGLEIIEEALRILNEHQIEIYY